MTGHHLDWLRYTIHKTLGTVILLLFSLFQVKLIEENEVMGNAVKHIIYQWNGLESNTEIRNRAEIYAKKLFKELEYDACMLVQMTEMDEPPHFLQIFKGKLIIFQDESNIQKFYSTDANNNDKLTQNQNEPFLVDLSRKLRKIYADTVETPLARTNYILKVTGDSSYNARAIEVYPLIMMSSKECYILKTGQQAWIWCGQSSTGDEREIAKGIGALLGVSSTLVLEHKESKDFWQSVSALINQNACGSGLNDASSTNSYSSSTMSSGSSAGSSSLSGQRSPSSLNYSNNRSNSKIKCYNETPLYLVWLQNDQLHCHELIGYEQSDLDPYCIYILDALNITYLWLGKLVPRKECDKYFSIVNQYQEKVLKMRRNSTAISIIRQNDEPNVFTGFFNNWNRNYWKVR